ncbi:MAG TPA: hypothetical protein VML19_08305 [Verrucomicrobiae bacterium]|nr:hypothetical protein [Verrucomicrobiae bacterium]
MTAPVHVESRLGGSRNLLVLAGEIGLDAIGVLYEEAPRLSVAAGGVDIDWREAQVVSGGCLQVLLALGTALSQRALTLRAAADNPKIRQSLELAGWSTRFPSGKAS